MDTKQVLAAIALVAGLLMAGPDAAAQSPQSPTSDAPRGKVLRVRSTPVFYENQGGTFRRMAEQPTGQNLVGMEVRDISSRGYVLVGHGSQEWWVARSLVVIDSVGETVMPKARCQNLLSVGTDTRTAGVRGAGQGCGK